MGQDMNIVLILEREVLLDVKAGYDPYWEDNEDSLDDEES